MDTMISTLLDSLPAIGFAIFIVVNQQGTIKTLLENQQKLIDQLMALHPPQTKEDARNIVANG